MGHEVQASNSQATADAWASDAAAAAHHLPVYACCTKKVWQLHHQGHICMAALRPAIHATAQVVNNCCQHSIEAGKKLLLPSIDSANC